MRVLVVPEDFVKDEHVLRPIIEAMMKALGRPKAKVVVCKDPRLHGTGEALRWEMIKRVLERNRGMFDVCLLCVDRDGTESRRETLDSLELKAREALSTGRAFFAEQAWQELEVWILAGLDDLPSDWPWSAIREERDSKERFFSPHAERRGLRDAPGEGRGVLAREAAQRFSAIRTKSPEVGALTDRVKAWIEAP